ncbi:SDR family oxidoreductase [Kiloniella laminariae]|uniref:SDR family oxidoreductase n=1 Tax=Kiloniella laminariae TaxID=454162 RepID=A0ABT4LEK0_9PROT|nr:UDP-glucuronic acid decarboxylase family protein [Kiloniella laminariae]MCZ4279517.1 SDR family oxidoreductase [Kiloniella laminariae]
MTRTTTPVLVTGGAGFIGSHLCEALIARGEYVLCVDNLMTGSLDNLVDFMRHPRFEFRRHDITEPLALEVSAIYNLACPASPVDYQRDPVHTLKTCVQGALNMLELARNCNVPILQASTSEVYGDPLQHPQVESYWGNVNPIGPRSCYDEGKRCAETLFYDYHRMYGVDTRVIRIFNTYGPRMQVGDGRVVSNFIVSALKDMPLTIYGDGQQTRSFCYVDDLVRLIIACMDNENRHGAPINAGNPEEYTMLELADLVRELVGGNSSLTHLALPEDDPKKRKPDIEQARVVLDWEPEVSVRDGLARTRDYFRTVLARKPSKEESLPEIREFAHA